MTRALKPSGTPIDPVRERARLAATFASLPPLGQKDALRIVADWPRLIHALAQAGELAGPVAEPSARRRGA